MPRKSDSIPINNENLDRRVKLTADQKNEIRLAYKSGEISTYKLAKIYGVSRRTIQFILSPEKLQENKQRRAERGGTKIYYDKTKHARATREHREYKKKLYAEGKIQDKREDNE